jgi:hypothetical protein
MLRLSAARSAFVSLFPAVAAWIAPMDLALSTGSGSSEVVAPPVEDRLMFWGYHPLTLLNENAVRRELKVSREQSDTLDRLVTAYLELLRPIALRAKEANTLPENHRREQLTQLVAERSRVMSRASAQAVDSLEERQRQRLAEIAFQLRGVTIFFVPEMEKRLRLDDRQRQEIAAVRGWLTTQLKSVPAEEDPEVAQGEPSAEPCREAERRIEALLTPQQREAVDQLRGHPIPFSAREVTLTLRRRPMAPYRD